MRHSGTLLGVISLVLVGNIARPLEEQVILDVPKENSGSPRPLVIWHGLGDTALSEGISGLIEDIKAVHPGIFVHSVQIPEGGSLDAERKAGFFGDMVLQGDEGCVQLNSIEELKGGFDAMGFSQGGLYLRNYVQYCNDPPVHNLLTFGTPHYGISALIPCPTPPTLSCLLAARAARSGIYTSWAQSHLVTAQYYRDVERLDEFMEYNIFLRDLNGELKGESPLKSTPSDSSEDLQSHGEMPTSKLTWREKGGNGVDGLDHFIAVMFDADRTVSPAESAHFATYTPGNKTLVRPMTQQELYTDDWIGIRSLDERGGLVLEHCPGEHMDLNTGDCAMRLVKEWVGWKG